MANPRSAQLQQLIHRRDKVLAVLHPPTAAHARIMEQAGCEALFVGTGGVVGAYTGHGRCRHRDDAPNASTIAGWIADSVSIPVIMDGDTGHGGIMAVRRMVRECIRAGIAGMRIDDQPIEGKRKTQSAGRRGRAARPGDRALPRRGRHEERARPEFRRDGAMLRPRRRQRRRSTTRSLRLKAYREEAGRRLGAVRIAAFGRRNQSGARRGRRGRSRS